MFDLGTEGMTKEKGCGANERRLEAAVIVLNDFDGI